MLEIYHKGNLIKKYYKELVFGGILLVTFTGLIFWLKSIKSLPVLTIGIALLTLAIGVITYIRRTIKRKQDIESGAPPEDEFSKLAKVYAGNRAFLSSMYLWLLIFVFNASFPSNEMMLGIGILGSAFIYGISLWYFNATGEFNE